MRLTLILLVAVALLSVTGCNKSVTNPFGSNSAKTKTTPPPVGAMQSGTKGYYYYDFEDVLIPGDMELDTDATFVMETTREKTGVMVFDGRVERISLTNRIIENMATKGWTMRSAFKSSRTILIFEKPGKYCIINITDGSIKTHMEVWVAPSAGESSAVLEPPTTSFAPDAQPTEELVPIQEQGLTQ